MSTEAPRGNGTGGASTPRKPEGGFSRFFRRLFAVPSESQPPQQPSQPRSLNQLLDDIDHGRVLSEREVATARLSEQQAKEKALQEAWDKAKSLETSIKNYLATADPVITEGLSIIARRTWGNDGFIIFKYGPSWKKRGRNDDRFEIIGTSSIADVDLINLEAVETPPPAFLSGAEYNYHAQSMDKSKAPAYDPDASYYKATLKFRGGKPDSLQFGYGITLHEKELEMIGQENVLTSALLGYYRHGPEVHIKNSEN